MRKGVGLALAVIVAIGVGYLPAPVDAQGFGDCPSDELLIFAEGIDGIFEDFRDLIGGELGIADDGFLEQVDDLYGRLLELDVPDCTAAWEVYDAAYTAISEMLIGILYLRADDEAADLHLNTAFSEAIRADGMIRELLANAGAVDSTLGEELPDFSHYDGIEQGFTDEGFPRLGDPDAPVILEEFSSFTCPHCNNFSQTLHRLIEPYIRTGELAVVFIPITAEGYSSYAPSLAAMCAGEQGMFWQMHDVIFWGARQYGQTAFGTTVLRRWAESMGLDMAAFDECLESDEVADLMRRAIDIAVGREVRGTPALFFNGERPDCGDIQASNPTCEGNLPYEMVVQNIEDRLEQ